jgi:hypothetical protein
MIYLLISVGQDIQRLTYNEYERTCMWKKPAVDQSVVCTCTWVVRKLHQCPLSRVGFRADTLIWHCSFDCYITRRLKGLDGWFLHTLEGKWVGYLRILTLILLTWKIWWAQNNASRWQMGFNSAFKELSLLQVSQNENAKEYTLQNYLPTTKCLYYSSRLNTRITCPFIVPHTLSVKVWCLKPLIKAK